MNAQSITVGDFQLTSVSGGTLWIDGGNMFGVIPKVMWEKACPPDSKNRILLDTNCLLIRTPDSLGLIDTGYGDKAGESFRARHDLAAESQLPRNLAAMGVSPDDIDWVILTHLHFDHAGGCTGRDADGRLRPTFPTARHVVQKVEWEDATSNKPELAGAYFSNDFLPLAEAGLVELVDEDAEVVPGVSVRRTNGHTRGHQIVMLASGGHTACYLGDLCPLTPHLRTFWSMSYDQFPLTVRTSKPVVLSGIADGGQVAIFGHDPKCRFARIRRDDRGHSEWLLEPIVT
ncbi:MAG TPA: MBL fold metallo-hydrolase [Caulifigura sp.]|nr:MBL fold metallo-hydrolase [Caulifigura sp.]